VHSKPGTAHSFERAGQPTNRRPMGVRVSERCLSALTALKEGSALCTQNPARLTPSSGATAAICHKKMEEGKHKNRSQRLHVFEFRPRRPAFAGMGLGPALVSTRNAWERRHAGRSMPAAVPIPGSVRLAGTHELAQERAPAKNPKARPVCLSLRVHIT